MQPDLHHRTPTTTLEDRFRAFVAERAFPCVGAKSALAHNAIRIVTARDIGSAWDDLRIYAAIRDFTARYRRRPGPFQSLAVLFADSAPMDEEAFETALWARIQSLSDKDRGLGQPWDSRVSPEVENVRFSLSFGGEAFFVVGMHPGASRPARRFEAPVMVFNPHDQFERLRAEGRYEPLREKIIARDVALAGSPNPMMARFGEESEARQYSGREVGPDWKCPFHARTGTARSDDD